MWFKNLQVYRLPAPWAYTPEQLEAALAPNRFAPASSNELLRQGWDSPRGTDQLVHTVNKQMLILLGAEKKLLPASVINQVAKSKAVEMEEAQGFAPGRKAMKELRERVADELLPRAFAIRSNTWAWIDPVNGWLVIDAATASKADDVVKLLLKAVDRMPLESLRVQRSPVAVMTAWLETDEAPVGFTVDQDATMQATGESKASIRYVKHTLEVDDIRRHIKTGKQCTRLAMTWNDKISFVLTESLAIKSIKPMDVLTENYHALSADDERFNNDFMLMSGELAKMLADVVEALGGEAHDLVSKAQAAAGERPAAQNVERAIRLTADLYKQRDRMREVLGSLYVETLRTYTLSISEAMTLSGKGAIETALELAKTTSPTAAQCFICAAVEMVEPSGVAISAPPAPHSPDDGDDPLFDKAVVIVQTQRRASISLVQRHLRIGYNRAARLLEAMEVKGVVGAMQSNGHRDILGTGAQP